MDERAVPTTANEKGGRQSVLFVLFTVLIDTMGFGIIAPVLPKLIVEIGHVDLSHAAEIGGYLLIVFAGLQFLFGPVMGNLSDAYGRRPVLLVSHARVQPQLRADGRRAESALAVPRARADRHRGRGLRAGERVRRRHHRRPTSARRASR